ncbi:zinc ABC transporter substrate-binding protein [Thermaerobacter sp. PB12/4term]|uniref:metal ABC transporter substrate-binding protein n=1 Tax=Thermaerobacter sp. PB12/4term TaxID=2293838 RepID=UPI0013140B2B|nr:zinc ABC transporter substrate-binding protein [Thermaerobacter sp. PB12/4term]QIA27706.1 zinc ABC transporter substrate-binding protein [Thermaerobacter sp. PB12/4term]
MFASRRIPQPGSQKARRRAFSVAAVLLAVSLLAACGRGSTPQSGGEPTRSDAPVGEARKVRVVATFLPYAELARIVGGDRAEVHMLVPDGLDPHDWEPRPSDAMRIEQADLVIYNGAGLEPWLLRMLDRAPADRPARIEAVAGLQLLPAPKPALAAPQHEHDHDHDHGHDERHTEGHGDEGHAHDHDTGGVDPHIWLDPVLLQDVVKRLRDALSQLDPEGAQGYAQRAEALIADLARVDSSYRDTLSTCQQRQVLVTHGFYAYPAARYGLEQLPVMGVSPEAEPSPQTLARLADLARDRGIRTLFAETLVGRRVAETLAREAGLTVRVLNPMEGLTPEQRAQGVTLFDLFEQNLQELKAGLGCGA